MIIQDIVGHLDSKFDETEKICYQLFKNSQIKYFVYNRIYDSGEIKSLTTNVDFVAKILINHWAPSREELKILCSLGMNISFLSTYLPLPMGDKVAAEKFEQLISLGIEHSIYNSIVMVDRIEDYYRVCSFGTKGNKNTAFNYFLNCLNILKRFIGYFEETGEHLISYYSDGPKIIMPHYADRLTLSDEDRKQLNSVDDWFFAMPSIANPRFSVVTEREKECLALLSQGYTMKRAALKLNISHRTVEQHLRNIKDKLNLHTRNQLVEYWHDMVNI